MTGVLEVAVTPTAGQINRTGYARLAAMTRDQVQALSVEARQARVDRLFEDPTEWEVPDILDALGGISRSTWDKWLRASRTGRRRSGGPVRDYERVPPELPATVERRPGKPKLRYRAGDLRRAARGAGFLDKDLFPQRRVPPGPVPRQRDR